MIEVKSLTGLTFKELKKFAHQISSSDTIYEIDREVKDNIITFNLRAVINETAIEKKWSSDVSICERYNEIAKKGYSFGAYEGNELAGYIIAESREWNNSLWVEMIQVKAGKQFKGTGTMLLNAIEVKARLDKIRIIDIETQNTNVPAIKFYRKNGYEFAGLNMTLYDPSEIKDEIAIFMSKIIKQ